MRFIGQVCSQATGAVRQQLLIFVLEVGGWGSKEGAPWKDMDNNEFHRGPIELLKGCCICLDSGSCKGFMAVGICNIWMQLMLMMLSMGR